MDSMSLLNEDDLDLVVAYSLSSGEGMNEALVNAFHAANIDVFEKPTQLVDWVNPDVFESLQWTTDRRLYLITQIWDHRVVITAEEIRIYTQSALIGDDKETVPPF